MPEGRRAEIGIELCGEVCVEVGGRRRERDLPGRLGRILLGYLALNRHRAVPRDELVAALWPREAPDQAAATLSTLLSGVRRCLGSDLVQGRRELRLTLPEGADVDVERAAGAAEAGRAALAAGEPERAAACAEGALDVLERTLLPGFDAPWLEDRRRELEEQALEALEVLAEAALAAGEPGLQRAQSASRQLLALAPYRESGYALLMRAQEARGNVAEALRTFERARRLLREELGATPSAELREAHRRLLEASAEAEPAGEGVREARAGAAGGAPVAGGPVPLPGALARVARRPFVGRRAGLERLAGQLAAAAGGERRFAFLAGEPGIGKTSLAAAFAAGAHERGEATVLYGRCDEEALAPYQPFADVLSHWAAHGAAERVAAELPELGRLVPQLPAPGAPPGAEPDAERYRLFEEVVSALALAAGDRPLLLVLDDLHWADPPTLRLLRHLARADRPERLLVAGVYRDVEAPPGSPLRELTADLRREHVFELLELGGLDARETGTLIDVRRPGPLAGDAAQRLHELTGGNPLFLDEILRMAAEADDPAAALAELGVPEGVKDVVRRRVARLGERAHEALTLAAVAGPSLPAGLLGDEVVDAALAARLLAETDRADRLTFAHALIRETLYGEPGEARRARLHLRVAETLEQRRAELRPRPAELAHHFFLARHVAGPEPAIRYAREAAERASESLAWEDAAVQLERALAADELREPPDPGDRCELLLALGDARLRSGHAAARGAFADAAALARGRSPEQLARAAIGYGGRYYEAGVVDHDLIALLREALDALPEHDSDLRSHVLARLAEILHFAGETGASVELSAQAVESARALGDDEALAAALAGRHVSLLNIAHLGERLEVSERLLELGRRANDPEGEMHALHARIFDLLEHGDLPGARAAAARLGTLARNLRQPLFAHFAVGWECVFAQVDGRLGEAERLAAESLAMRQALEAADAENVFAAQLFMIRRAQGRLAELLDAVLDAVERYPALAPWRSALPLVHLAAGDERRAREELDRLVSGAGAIPRDFFWLTATSLLADAAGALRAAGPAAALEPLLEPHADRFVQIGYVANDGPVLRLLGVLAAARGDPATAVERLEQAVARCAAAGAPAFEARARADLAEALAAAGDAAGARQAAGRALDEARALGLAAVVERLEEGRLAA